MPRSDPNKLERDRRRRAEKDPHFLARRREIWRRYAAKPETKPKIQARSKIKHLCRTGKVQRGPCEFCGAEKTHAHHDDYSKPLDVRWLCAKCHGKLHAPR